MDLVLLMSVDPGFGGQGFIPGSVDKIARLRALLDAQGLDGVDLAVDGGIGEGTIGPWPAPGPRWPSPVRPSSAPAAGRSIAENLAALRRAAQAGGT